MNNEYYWNNVGEKYKKNWENIAEKKLSEKELSLIFSHFKTGDTKNILDVGVGCGRIIEGYLDFAARLKRNINIYGLDISESMVSFCKKKFSVKSSIKSIKKCDLSLQQICFDEKFDFVSAIRVLKYNKEWEKIVEKVFRSLNQNGIFVFTILNSQSVDQFAAYPLKVYKTTISHVKKVLEDTGYEVVEIKTFSRIPHIFYRIVSKVKLFAKIVLFIEDILARIFGDSFLGREIYIVCKKVKKENGLTNLYLNRTVDKRMVEIIDKNFSNEETILDLASGSGLYGQFLRSKCKKLIGFDIDNVLCAEALKTGNYSTVINENIFKVDQSLSHVENIFCSEFLEHLTNENLSEVLSKMEKITSKKIVITVPNPLSPHFKYDSSHILNYSIFSLLETLNKSTKFYYKIYPLGFSQKNLEKPLFRLVNPLSKYISILSPTVLYIGERISD